MGTQNIKNLLATGEQVNIELAYQLAQNFASDAIFLFGGGSCWDLQSFWLSTLKIQDHGDDIVSVHRSCSGQIHYTVPTQTLKGIYDDPVLAYQIPDADANQMMDHFDDKDLFILSVPADVLVKRKNGVKWRGTYDGQAFIIDIYIDEVDMIPIHDLKI